MGLVHRRRAGAALPFPGVKGEQRQIGRRWERKAETFLRRQGLKTLERNFLCRSGEIDLVMVDRECLVFVEVRFRSRDLHGSGADSVSPLKQARIIRAARHYLARYPAYATRPCRFDVISVGGQAGEVRLDWIRNAFDVSEG